MESHRIDSFLHRFGRNISRESLHVCLSPSFDAHPIPHAEINCHLEKAWGIKVAENHQIFNKEKFRLLTAPTASLRSEGTVVMRLGLTDYKSYLGLNSLSEENLRLLSKEAGDSHKSNLAHFPNKVGVGAIVETVDENLLFIRRSSSVGVYCGKYDVPGGHPEPEKIDLRRTNWKEVGSMNSAEENAMSKLEISARDEIFNSILDEIHQEINIPLEQLSDPVLMGTAYQGMLQTPSLAFYVTCKLNKAQVMEKYCDGPSEKFESTELRVVDIMEVLEYVAFRKACEACVNCNNAGEQTLQS